MTIFFIFDILYIEREVYMLITKNNYENLKGNFFASHFFYTDRGFKTMVHLTTLHDGWTRISVHYVPDIYVDTDELNKLDFSEFKKQIKRLVKYYE